MSTRRGTGTATRAWRTPSVIDGFTGEHRFLSNFWVHPMTWNGHEAASGEHHFNAAKTLDPVEAECVRSAGSPRAAKQVGRKVTLRPEWDEHARFEVMRGVTEAKFADPALRRRLLDTGDDLLIETNTWHDQVWGQCSCPKHRMWPGANHLGRTLMAVRSTLRGDGPQHWPRVALTGHRPGEFDAPQQRWVQDTLGETLAGLCARHGTRVAITGMETGADTWWAQTASAAGIQTWAYIPFEVQAATWPAEDQAVWTSLRAAAAREVVLAAQDNEQLLHARNDLMIRDANLVVAVHQPGKTTGGTANIIRKARAAGKPMIRVNPSDRTVTSVAP